MNKISFKMEQLDHIPVVDLSKITGQDTVGENELASTAKELFRALSGIGFAYLSNHGVDQNIIDKAFAASKAFFDLPPELKSKSFKNIKKSFHGYNRAGQESFTDELTHEERESFDFYHNLQEFPEDCEEFGPALTALIEALKPLTKNLYRLIAVVMNLDKEYFIDRSRNLDDNNIRSYSTFRTLYYPPISDDIGAGALRLGEHTDYGIISLVFQDDIGGLEVKTASGKWVPATPIPGTVLLNTGDLLEFWTGGRFPATAHRVLIPEIETKKRTHRQSMGYFPHPDALVKVEPLIGKVEEYDIITAEDHALKKLNYAFRTYTY